MVTASACLPISVIPPSHVPSCDEGALLAELHNMHRIAPYIDGKDQDKAEV